MISVAMAAYNGGKFIAEQIDSILAQTYHDFEIVICDDCSTDNTWDVIQQYVAKDDRIKAYKNEQNLGFRKNFVKAINLCSGEYIALSDQDDVWTDDHLQVLLDNIAEHTLACANSLLVNESGCSLNMTLKECNAVDYVYDDSFDKAYSSIYFHNMYQGACMMFHRSFVHQAVPLPDDKCYHDTWFALLACYVGGVVYVDKVINYYRIHSNNISKPYTQRRSKFKSFCRSVIYGPLTDRLPMLTAIENRVHLTEKQRNQVRTAIRFFNMNKLACHCLLPIYLLLHYKKIYNYA
jgi:glycosyltransferase involved in cell wall biosynthesis